MDNKFELFTKITLDLSEFEKSVKDIKKEMKKLTKELDKAFNDIEDASADAFDELSDNAKKSTKDVVKQFDKMTDDIEDNFDDIEDGAEDTLKSIEKQADKTTKKISDEFDDMSDDIEGSFDDVDKKADKAMGDVVKTVSSTTGKVSSEFKEMSDDAKGSFEDIESSADNALKGVATSAGKATGDVSNEFNDMADDSSRGFGKIKANFQSAVSGLSSIANGVSDRVKNAMSSIGDTGFANLDSRFNSSVDGISGIAKGVVSDVRNQFSKIGDGLTSEFSGIGSSLKTATSSMSKIAGNATTSVTGKFKKISGTAKGDFREIDGAFIAGTDQIDSTVTRVSASVSQKFDKIANSAKESASKAQQAFATKFKDIIGDSSSLESRVGADFEGAEGEAKESANGVKTAWSKLVTYLKNITSKMGTAFKVFAAAQPAVFKNMVSDITTVLGKLKSVAEKVTGKMSSEFKEAGAESESAISGIKDKLGGLAGAIAGAFGISAISGFITEVQQLNKEIGKTMFALQNNGMSEKASGDAYANAFGVLGDEGRASETVQNINRVATSEQELSNMTDLVIGAHLELGEAVTPEALAESIALSVQLGEVDGNLDDVLRDCGITTDEFNKKLGSCKTESERLALVNGLLQSNYGGLTEEYKKAHPELTKLNEAQAQNQIASMQLGESLAPLKTAFYNFITPVANWLAEKLPSAIETAKTVFSTFGEVLSPAFDAIKEGFSKLSDGLSQINWQSVWDWFCKIGGYIKDTFQPTFDTLTGILEKAKTKLDEFATSENAQKIIDGITNTFKWLSKHGEEVKGIIIGIAAGAAVYAAVMGTMKVVGAAVAAVQALINAVMLASPLTWVCVGIAALVAAFVILWNKCEGFRKFWKGLWQAFKGAINEFKPAMNDVKVKIGAAWDWVKEKCGKVWGWIKEKAGGLKDSVVKTIDKMKTGVKNGMKAVANKGFINPFNSIVKGVKKGMQAVVDTINNIGSKIGIDKLINIKFDTKSNVITPLAKGTNNWQGGTALVGEAGAELVADPKLGTFLADQPMILPLSKGASVLRNSKTQKVLKNMGIKAYADGKNESWWDKVVNGAKDIWDFVKNPLDLLKSAFGKIKALDSVKLFGSHATKIFNWIAGKAKDWIGGKLKETQPDTWGGLQGTYAERWDNYAKGWAQKALKNAGYESGTKAYKNFMTAMKIVGRYESGYNNSAHNKTDKNAKAGNPSKGWLQFIRTTFDGYKFKGYDTWLNPVHQAMAFINYANKRYGGALKVPGVKSVLAGGKYKPYANGGMINNPTMALMGEAGYSEAVVPLHPHKIQPFGNALADSLLNNLGSNSAGGSGEITINLVTNLDGRVVAQQTAKFTKDELAKLEAKESRRNGKR